MHVKFPIQFPFKNVCMVSPQENIQISQDFMMIAIVAIAPPSRLHPHSRDQEEYSLNYHFFEKFIYIYFFLFPASFNR